VNGRNDWARHRGAFGLVVLCSLLAWLAGCGEERPLRERENKPPQIALLTADPDSLLTNETARILCRARDDDADTLGYTWTASIGSFTGAQTDSTRIWKAPPSTGVAQISVTVTDGEEQAFAQITIHVTERTGSLRGVVGAAVDSAAVLEGAEVRAELIADPKRAVVDSTNARGEYRLDGLALGETLIRFTKEGYVSRQTQLTVHEGLATITMIELRPVQPLSRLRGLVRNSLLAPVPGAIVEIDGLSDTTDAQGRYDISGIEQGTQTLSVTAAGYAPVSLLLGLSLPEHAQDVELDATPLPSIDDVVAAKDLASLQVVVSWTPLDLSAVQSYRVYQSVDGAPSIQVGGDLPSTASELTVQGEANRRYRFFVTALNIEDEEGNPSELSNTVVLTPLTAMVTIPTGRFVMGNTPAGYGNETHPGNPVEVGAFRLEATEVTNRQYLSFLYEALSANRIQADADEVTGGGDLLLLFSASRLAFDPSSGAFTIQASYEEHPVVGVTWYGAQAYCVWIGRRLPSEAEWEKAARGVSTVNGSHPSGVGYGAMFPWGNDPVSRTRANYQGGIGRTEPVVSRVAGAQMAWGTPIYTLAGNVWEWCADWASAYRAPHNPPLEGSSKVLRGGSFQEGASWLLVGARFSIAPDQASRTSGFRCAANP